MLCFRFWACCSEAPHAAAVILVYRSCEVCGPASTASPDSTVSTAGSCPPGQRRRGASRPCCKPIAGQSVWLPQRAGPLEGAPLALAPKAVVCCYAWHCAWRIRLVIAAWSCLPGHRRLAVACIWPCPACRHTAYGQHHFQREFFCSLTQDNCAAFHVGQLKSHQNTPRVAKPECASPAA